MALGVTAGQPATAAQYNALVPFYLPQASDQTITNSTTLTNHNTFASIAVAAGTIWEVYVAYDLGATNLTGHFKSQWVVTGTVTVGRRIIRAAATGSTVASDWTSVNSSRDNAAGTVAFGVDDASTVRTSAEERVIFSGGASGGTYTLQWAQNAAGGVGQSTTMYAGSYLIARRLS